MRTQLEHMLKAGSCIKVMKLATQYIFHNLIHDVQLSYNADCTYECTICQTSGRRNNNFSHFQIGRDLPISLTDSIFAKMCRQLVSLVVRDFIILEYSIL